MTLYSFGFQNLTPVNLSDLFPMDLYRTIICFSLNVEELELSTKMQHLVSLRILLKIMHQGRKH